MNCNAVQEQICRGVRPVAMAGLALLLAVGCRRTHTLGDVSDTTFVATMRELRAISADTALDSAARGSARGAILRRHAVTAAQLEAAARALARRPEDAAAVWSRITAGASPPAATPRGPTPPAAQPPQPRPRPQVRPRAPGAR